MPGDNDGFVLPTTLPQLELTARPTEVLDTHQFTHLCRLRIRATYITRNLLEVVMQIPNLIALDISYGELSHEVQEQLLSGQWVHQV